MVVALQHPAIDEAFPPDTYQYEKLHSIESKNQL